MTPCSADDRRGVTAVPLEPAGIPALRAPAMRVQRASHSFDRSRAHETKFEFAAAAAPRAGIAAATAKTRKSSTVNAVVRIADTFYFKC